MTEQYPRRTRPLFSICAFAGEAVIDLAAFAGTGSITYGVWQIYHPAAFIVGGAFLLTGALSAARRSAAR